MNEAKTPPDILLRPDLFDTLIKEVQVKVVGEADSIGTILLCCAGSLVENHAHASYNLLVNDSSGVGKDFITSSTLELFPACRIERRTRISPQALIYWKQRTKKQIEADVPPWDWDGKILYSEDCSNAILNHETLKVMASSSSKVTVVKDQAAIDLEIIGKPVILVTSASASPSAENLRRFAILNLDDSTAQTRAIIKAQASRAKSGNPIEMDYKLREALQQLDRCKVIIPYSDNITAFVPDGQVMRTHFNRLLDLIKASTALYQYQRSPDLDGSLKAEAQDYEIARWIIGKITSNPKMISLTKTQQRILSLFESLEQGVFFAISELEPKATFCSERQLRRECDKLTDWGFLKKETQDRAESRKAVMVYSYLKQTKLVLPSFNEMMSSQSSQSNVSSMSSVSSKGIIDINDTLDIITR